MSNPLRTGVIILAAGSSSRLGQPKQLVDFKGKKLLQHAIDCVNQISAEVKIIINGANSDLILNEVETKSLHTYINHDWKEGMASSIRLGVEKCLKHVPDIQAILILVSDQPFISPALMEQLLNSYESENSIVASHYKFINGVPALFGKRHFKELLELKGDKGARSILKKHASLITQVKFDQGIFDLDTPEDLVSLKKLEDDSYN